MTVLDRFDLSGKTALVTGSTRGLGRATVRALAEAGAQVIVHGREQTAAEAVRRELEESGHSAHAVSGELTDPAALEGVAAGAVQKSGRIDILVNNAGVSSHGPSLDVGPDDWAHVMGTNVTAPWHLTQLIGRGMVERGSGVIVNVGSMSGMIVNRPQWQPAYNASKAAVHHLTKSLAAEWAPHGVRVNAIAPGYLRTATAAVDDPRFQRHWIDDAPQQRAATTDELGPAMVFLASDASSFMTGSILVIDGGYTVY